MSLRIRTIARLTGVREATLRAWERRYGFPRPSRTEKNYRLYSQEEVEAVRRVAQLIGTGLSASEAISEVRARPVASLPASERLVERFWSSVALMDAAQARRVLDEAAEALPPERLTDDFLLPLLRDMDTRLDIAREHMASALIRQRLWTQLERPEEPGEGPSFLLACPSGERHEGGLLGIAIQLERRRHRVVVLGADTPTEALASACAQLQPDVVGLSYVGKQEPAALEASLSGAVRACAPISVIAGGPGAREHLRAVFRAGALYAESAEELMLLWQRSRSTAESRS